MELGTSLCTNFDGYMNKLCHEDMMISWQITLTDGLVIYGDYERPNLPNPWERLRTHCLLYDVLPAKVELYMFGAEHKVFFEDPKGLNGISVMRGVAKEQSMDGQQTQSYQTLTVCLLDDSCDHVNVAKYTWPHNEFEQKDSVRQLSINNLENMIFKHESKKLLNQKVQECLYGTRV
tara:strand:- start:1051 stop:1581 length:531 start_codon:yes stop_codon:yes gene_type:complete